MTTIAAFPKRYSLAPTLISLHFDVHQRIMVKRIFQFLLIAVVVVPIKSDCGPRYPNHAITTAAAPPLASMPTDKLIVRVVTDFLKD